MKRPWPAVVAALILCLAAGAAYAQAPTPFRQKPLQVGEYVDAAYETSHPYFALQSAEPQLVWSQVIHHPGATYIAPHFDRFELAPGDYVVVRSPDGSRSWRFEGYGKADLGRAGNGGFWGIHIRGETAVVELFSRGSSGAYGVSIDRYGRGFTEGEMADRAGPNESICTTDDKENAVCYMISEPDVYDKGRAVARLLIQGASLCTGWLLGDEGHLMTNEHCISSATAAMNTDYEFMAEGAMCATVCPQLGCDGTIEATTATFVQDDVFLDYALVQLPTNITGTYGFLQFRETGAVLEERIYSAQHPGGRGKEIALFSTYPENPSGFSEVDSLTEPVCAGGADPEVGYFMDTEGGSSGSPVLGYSDNLVVALHHCRGAGFCSTGNPASDDPNRGLDVIPVIADLGGNLPNNAVAGGNIFTDGFESGNLSAWSAVVP